MEDKLLRLQQMVEELRDIRAAMSVLSWDRETYMPDGGANDRSVQIATLGRIFHEKFTSDEMGKLLEDLSRAELGGYDSLEASSVRKLKRDYDQKVKIPSSLVASQAQAQGLATQAWVKAKHTNDFPLFLSHLEKLTELAITEAEHLGYQETPYDALLDKFEPGITAAQVDRLFGQLRDELVPLVQQIAQADQVDDGFFQQSFPPNVQWQLTMELLKVLRYDFDRGRQDRSEHPFTTTFSRNDVRVTTRLDEYNLASGLLATVHEYGHAMYEQGIPAKLARTAVGQGASSGVHESQSRLWENQVGRSRAFWEYAFPLVQQYFPQQLRNCTLDQFYRAINKVAPSLIRVEADEVTYNLHIFFRYELERGLIEGNIAPRELPQLWNDKVESYLGIKPDSDSAGVLQDIHWAGGMFGYFPTYSLGSILAVQWFERIRRDHSDLDLQFSKGNFGQVREWLNQNVHIHGAKFTLPELVDRVLGEKLTVTPFIEYTKRKYLAIYG